MSQDHPFADVRLRAELHDLAEQGTAVLKKWLIERSGTQESPAWVIGAGEALLPARGRAAILPLLGDAVTAAHKAGDLRLATRGLLVAARLSLLTDRHDQVPGQLEALEVLGRQAGDGFRVGFGRLLQAELAMNQGEMEAARERLSGLLRAFDESEGIEGLGTLRRYAYTLQIVAHAAVGDHKGLKEALQAADALTEEPSALRSYHRALLDLAAGSTRAAKERLQWVATCGEDPGWAFEAWLLLAQRGLLDEGLEQARALAPTLPDPTAVLRVRVTEARLALARGDTAEAEAVLDEASEVPDPDLLLIRAEVALSRRPAAEALRWVEKLLEVAEARGLAGHRAHAHLLAARLYPDPSVRAWQLRQARSLFERLGDLPSRAEVMLRQAFLDLQMKGPEEAMATVLTTEDLARRCGRMDLLASALLAHGVAARALGRRQEAEAAWTEGHELASSHDMEEVAQACARGLEASTKAGTSQAAPTKQGE